MESVQVATQVSALLSGVDSSLNDCLGCDIEFKGIATSPHGFVATESDPWITIRFSEAVSFAVLEVEAGASAGTVVLYHRGQSDDFSEAGAYRIAPTELKRIIAFKRPVIEVRIDLTEEPGDTSVTRVELSGYQTSDDALLTYYADSLGVAESAAGALPKCLLVTHDLSETGAPLLACNIARTMMRHRTVLVMTVSSEFHGILPRYEALGIPVYPVSAFLEAPGMDSHHDLLLMTLDFLKRNGFDSALLNTVVSSSYAGYFKSVGMTVISLIHETAATISISGWEDYARKSASFSDARVFPANTVAKGYKQFEGENAPGATLVRPQGVYLDAVQEAEIDEILAKLPEGRRIVLCSGSMTLRKGFDLFCAMAGMMSERMPGQVVCVWVGNRSPGSDDKYEWMKLPCRHLIDDSSLMVLPFMEADKYKALLRKSSVFWSTSRDDTFPSVVLEAMREQVPVVAFKGSGGVDDMLENGRGWLVEEYSLTRFVDSTVQILQSEESKISATCMRAWDYIDRSFDFDSYVDFLETLLDGEPVVDASLAQSRYPLPQECMQHEPASQAACVDDGALDGKSARRRKKSWFSR